MENKEEAEQIKFNVDLCEQAVHHLAFLKEVDSILELKQADILKRSVYRYERFWLPLAAEHPEECLAAPLDIEWVWHCHMLNPIAYETDCNTVVGATVNHTLRSQTRFRVKQEESRKYWIHKYESEDEPFTVDFSAPYDKQENESFKSKLTYDIVAATQRQMVFYYQVSLPHYKDSKFLEHSLTRYKQFLFIKTKVEQDFLVPCYNIDLIWHTHQLNPVYYKADMIRIIGHLFNHEDNTDGRGEDSKLSNAGKETSENWRTFYNESFSLFGAMYRGKPPTGRLHNTGTVNFNLDEEYASDAKTSFITLLKLTLNLPSGNSHIHKTFKLKGACTNGDSIVKTWFTLKDRAETSKESTLVWTNVGYYQLDTKSASGLRFDLHCLAGRACCKSETFIGSKTLDLKSIVAHANIRGPIIEKVILDNDITLDIDARFSKPECEHELEAKVLLCGRAVLRLEKGKYQQVLIPDDVQQLLGPVALEKRPQGTSSMCKAATHRLKSVISGTTLLTAKVIHSHELIMSVVQVFYNDKMAVVAHLVASDQLPLPTQVSDDKVTLNPKQGERAILIKNHQGDWGVLLGHWTGFKRGVAGRYTSNQRAVYGSPGTLAIKFYKFSTATITTFLLPYERNFYTFRLGPSEVDLRSGVIQVDASSKEVAEYVAVAFSVSLLHVLCIPRPEGWQESQMVQPDDGIRGKKSLTIIPSDEMALIIASGLQCSTPSNYYMSKNCGNTMCSVSSGNVTKYEAGDWEELPGEDDGDPNCNGSGCGGSNVRNEKDFNAGIVGAGCGGCGGFSCRSECGGSQCGSGKGNCVGAYIGRGVRSNNVRGSTETGNEGGSSTAFTATFDAAFSVCDIDTDSGRGGCGSSCGGGCGGGGGGGGGGCGGGCD